MVAAAATVSPTAAPAVATAASTGFFLYCSYCFYHRDWQERRPDAIVTEKRKQFWLRWGVKMIVRHDNCDDN